MKAKDTEGRYGFALRTESLIGDIVSPAVARRIMQSLFLPDEQPSERNVQQRLRDALNSGSLQVKGLGPSGLKRLQSALSLGRVIYNAVPAAGTVVDDPSVAAAVFHPIACEPVEKFAVIALRCETSGAVHASHLNRNGNRDLRPSKRHLSMGHTDRRY